MGNIDPGAPEKGGGAEGASDISTHRIILNKNWNMFLIKNNKFYYNISANQFEKYIKQNPNYSRVVKINQILFVIFSIL